MHWQKNSINRKTTSSSSVLLNKESPLVSQPICTLYIYCSMIYIKLFFSNYATSFWVGRLAYRARRLPGQQRIFQSNSSLGCQIWNIQIPENTKRIAWIEAEKAKTNIHVEHSYVVNAGTVLFERRGHGNRRNDSPGIPLLGFLACVNGQGPKMREMIGFFRRHDRSRLAQLLNCSTEMNFSYQTSGCQGATMTSWRYWISFGLYIPLVFGLRRKAFYYH